MTKAQKESLAKELGGALPGCLLLTAEEAAGKLKAAAPQLHKQLKGRGRD
eukprot:gene15354-6520_t